MFKIAVLIPVYNNVDGLLTSLFSIERSSMAGINIDVVIVDDGSWPEITLPSQLEFSFNIILLKETVNSGIVAAMNAGLKHIMEHDYSYIARLDAGDTVMPERFIEQVRVLVNNPDVYLVGSYANFVDMQGEPVYTYTPPVTDSEIRKSMYYNNALCHPAVMFRSEGVKRLGFYSSDYPHAEDYEYFYRFINTYKAFNVPKALVNVEINPTGISIKNRRKQIITRLKIQLSMLNISSINSMLGLFKTFMLLATPYSFVLKVKKLLGKAG